MVVVIVIIIGNRRRDTFDARIIVGVVFIEIVVGRARRRVTISGLIALVVVVVRRRCAFALAFRLFAVVVIVVCVGGIAAFFQCFGAQLKCRELRVLQQRRFLYDEQSKIALDLQTFDRPELLAPLELHTQMR